MEGNSHIAVDQLRPQKGFAIRTGGTVLSPQVAGRPQPYPRKYLDLGYLNADMQMNSVQGHPMTLTG